MGEGEKESPSSRSDGEKKPFFQIGWGRKRPSPIWERGWGEGTHFLFPSPHHSVIECNPYRLDPPGRAHFVEDVTDMMIDRARADDKPPRDLVVAQPLGDERQHLQLALR